MASITNNKRIIEGQRLASYYGPKGAPVAHLAVPQGQGDGAIVVPLGTYTKSSSPCPPSKHENTVRLQALRAQKYLLQNYIRTMIMQNEGVTGSDLLDMDLYNKLPRVVKCVRTRASEYVGIKKSAQHGKAFYTGLVQCGSVWACPVCASKIQERRREEIAKAVDWAYKKNLVPVMITFTHPHYAFNKASDLLEKQASAFKYLRSGKSFSEFKKSAGMAGFIRSLEVTYGGNGWHIHTHELWFVDSSVCKDGFIKYVSDRWEKACSKNGMIPRGKLKAFRKNAVDFKFNANCSEYLAKQDDEKIFWGVDREMTKGAVKKGSTVHPFQLVQLAFDNVPGASDKFLEYMEAFKGKAQIFWSRGLKDLVGIEDLSDKQLAEKRDDECIDIANLEMFAWQKILDLNARARVLSMAENGGVDSVNSWLKHYGLHIAPTSWM